MVQPKSVLDGKSNIYRPDLCIFIPFDQVTEKQTSSGEEHKATYVRFSDSHASLTTFRKSTYSR
jgi:hypothetical protein